MKVLLIEDDATTVETVRLCLEIYRPGSVSVSAGNGTDGIELARNEVFDVIILDLGLPDVDGLEVLREIRGFSNTPVLVVSARHDPEVIAEALHLGAGDYILKPFDYPQLLSRLQAVAFPSPRGEQKSIVGGGFMIDFENRQAAVNGNPVEFTPLEWRLLSRLASAEGRLVPISTAAEDVIEDRSMEEPKIESVISRLREKLGDDPYVPKLIVCEHRAGYRFLWS